MSGIEKTKLQLDLDILMRRINGCRISADLKAFAENVLERASECIDYEPCVVRSDEYYYVDQS